MAKQPKSKKSQFLESIHQAVVIRMLRMIERNGEPITCAGDMNAAKRGPRAIAEARMTGMTPGEPDVRVYLPNGELLLVELKTEKGRLSKAQIERHKRLAEVGLPVLVVKQAHPLDTALQVGAEVARRLGYDDWKFNTTAAIAASDVLSAVGKGA